MMVLYHFAWDLHWFGFFRTDVDSDPAWKGFAVATAALFLLLVGVSLVLATRGANPWRAEVLRRQARRLTRIVLAAAAVTVATRWLFPDSYIFFGILDNIAVASVLGLALARAPSVVLLVLAGAALWLPLRVSAVPMDAPWLLWIGLGTYTPVSNDFVPLLPWFAAVLLGMAAGRALLARPAWARPFASPRRSRAARALARAGRHTLLVYLLHQPLLYGAVWGVAILSGHAPPAWASDAQASFEHQCTRQCNAVGGFEALCRERCACIVRGLRANGLWDRVIAGGSSAATRTGTRAVVAACERR